MAYICAAVVLGACGKRSGAAGPSICVLRADRDLQPAQLLIMRMDVCCSVSWAVVGVSMGTIGSCASVESRGHAQGAAGVRSDVHADHRAQSAAGSRGMEQSFAQLGRWVLAAQFRYGRALLLGGIGLRIFGPGFEAGATWVALLAIAHATNSFVGLAETVIMIQRPMLNLINSGGTVVLQFGASLLLIPSLGATGAALAMVLAYVTQGVLRYLELRFLFQWRWPWGALARPALAFAIAFAIALPLRLLIRRAGRANSPRA
jgi:hypothetical protein